MSHGTSLGTALLSVLMSASLAGPCVATVGCSDTVVEPAEAPVAALLHPEIAKIGEKVRFDASRSWTAKDAAKDAREGATLVRYTFLVADGSAAKSTAASFYEHAFEKAGSYAVQLTATDDLGRQTVAKSTIAVAADYSPACDAASAKACGSGECAGDTCAVVACAGDAACTTAAGAVSGAAGSTCVAGACKTASSP